LRLAVMGVTPIDREGRVAAQCGPGCQWAVSQCRHGERVRPRAAPQATEPSPDATPGPRHGCASEHLASPSAARRAVAGDPASRLSHGHWNSDPGSAGSCRCALRRAWRNSDRCCRTHPPRTAGQHGCRGRADSCESAPVERRLRCHSPDQAASGVCMFRGPRPVRAVGQGRCGRHAGYARRG
jgi:hypothetical protein